MIHICDFCGEPIETGDKVTMIVESVYKRTPQVDTFGLNESEMVYLMDTLCHTKCKGRFYPYEDYEE